MSAFMVGKNHIGYLVAAAFCTRFSPHGANRLTMEMRNGAANDGEAMAKLGNILQEENAQSILYRYPGDTEFAAYDSFEPEDFESMAWANIDPVQVLMSIACYQYQACEHPEWAGSKAKEYTDRLRILACQALPGYDDKEWGAPEPTPGMKNLSVML